MKRPGIVALAFFLVAGAGRADESPSYARHVRPMLAKYCLECHNSKSPKGGLDLDSFKAILEGGNKGEVLIPGNADESRLVTMVEGKKKPVMPPKTAKRRPKAAEITLLRKWVNAGAKDDSALVKVTLPQIKTRVPASAPVTGLAFDPLGRYLLAGRNRDLLVHRLRPDAPKLGFAGGEHISGLAFSIDGAYLAVASGIPGVLGQVHLYTEQNQPSAEKGITLDKMHTDVILDLAVSPDKQWLATASYDTRVVLTPLSPGKSDPRQPVILRDHSDGVYGVAFSPDNKRIATASADRAVKIWEVETGRLLLTLSEANDWLYAVAWSPDGVYLAAGGLDRSIRLYALRGGKAKLLTSVFAHEQGVQKLAFSRDGSKLYSLGQEGVAKVWKTAGMAELNTFERQPENVQSLAVSPDQKRIALGRYDGVVVLLDEATGKKLDEFKPAAQEKAPQKKPMEKKAEPKDPFPVQMEAGENESPSKGMPITLPASIHGMLDRAGDVDFFRFDARKGQQIGVQVLTGEIKSKVEPYLQLLDPRGNLLTESGDGLLGHTFQEDGSFALGIRDRELKGGPGMAYRLNIGPIPVVTSIYPLGLKRGEEREFTVAGVFLEKERVTLKAPADAAAGTRLGLPIASKHGKVHGRTQVVVGEFPETLESPGATPLPSPGAGNGIIARPGEADLWTFAAKKGERLIVEVDARRQGSPLDSVIEILDMKGAPVERAVLRCQAKTYVTFRDHNDVQGNVRIEAWDDLAVNDFIYIGGELVKIRALPTHPDADCNFFTAVGRRTGFLDTTPTHLAENEPMYKVSVHPPGSKFPPNGFPIFTLYYRNDDGGPGYGRDSRLFFDPPADGSYQVRIADTRGGGGPAHAYRLTVRPPRPSFNVRFNPDGPAVWRGGAIPINVTANRIDGYDGPIQIRMDDLPPGLHAPCG